MHFWNLTEIDMQSIITIWCIIGHKTFEANLRIEAFGYVGFKVKQDIKQNRTLSRKIHLCIYSFWSLYSCDRVKSQVWGSPLVHVWQEACYSPRLTKVRSVTLRQRWHAILNWLAHFSGNPISSWRANILRLLYEKTSQNIGFKVNYLNFLRNQLFMCFSLTVFSKVWC